jgi:hypothetical protein
MKRKSKVDCSIDKQQAGRTTKKTENRKSKKDEKDLPPFLPRCFLQGILSSGLLYFTPR